VILTYVHFHLVIDDRVLVEGTAGNTATLELTEYSKDLDFSPDEQLSAEPAGNALQARRRVS
jgi:hypothetical protein